MRQHRSDRMKRLLPHFHGIGIAVFNVHDSDKRKARKRIIEEFGQKAWKNEVLSKMKSGIMEIFEHPPTRILRRYAWYCAFSVEKRIAKEAA